MTFCPCIEKNTSSNSGRFQIKSAIEITLSWPARGTAPCSLAALRFPRALLSRWLFMPIPPLVRGTTSLDDVLFPRLLPSPKFGEPHTNCLGGRADHRRYFVLPKTIFIEQANLLLLRPPVH